MYTIPLPFSLLQSNAKLLLSPIWSLYLYVIWNQPEIGYTRTGS